MSWSASGPLLRRDDGQGESEGEDDSANGIGDANERTRLPAGQEGHREDPRHREQVASRHAEGERVHLGVVDRALLVSQQDPAIEPVSYTHLTLPTIYSV